MFRATHAGDLLELHDDDARTSATLVPARGAIVTSFRAGARELLYLDPATLADPSKNVRGGIPLLFPSPGKLAGDRFSRAGHAGSMKQHGFARDLPWSVAALDDRGRAAATLALEATPATRAMYPWSFRLTLEVALRASTLSLDLAIQNPGAEPLPCGFGIHPYFAVSDKAAARIPTPATRAFDNVTKQVVDFHGFDLTAKEVDMHLVDHGRSEASLELGDGSRVDVRASPELARWVVWTLAGRDFVCLEPWTSPGDALNTGEGLLVVPPGATHRLSITIAFTPAR